MATTSVRVLSAVTAATCALAAGLLLATSKRAPANGPEKPAADRAAYDRSMRLAALAATWTASPDYSYAVSALNAAPVTAAQSGSRFDPADMYWGLPRTDGHESVAAWCAGCHSLSLVMQQEASPQRWRYLLRWMTEKQGMPPLPPEEETAILAYLERHFGTE